MPVKQRGAMLASNIRLFDLLVFYIRLEKFIIDLGDPVSDRKPDSSYFLNAGVAGKY